jgi:hypothetical protein
MNNQQLINIIKYGNLKHGQAYVKIGDELIQLEIQSLDISVQPACYTTIKLEGIIKNDLAV